MIWIMVERASSSLINAQFFWTFDPLLLSSRNINPPFIMPSVRRDAVFFSITERLMFVRETVEKFCYTWIYLTKSDLTTSNFSVEPEPESSVTHEFPWFRFNRELRNKRTIGNKRGNGNVRVNKLLKNYGWSWTVVTSICDYFMIDWNCEDRYEGDIETWFIFCEIFIW